MHCTVLTASKAYGIGSGLTYETDAQTVCAGSAVTVPLRNRIVEGIVLQVSSHHERLAYDVKSVHEVLGSVPLLDESQLRTAQWIAEYYCCSAASAMRLFLPPPPWRKLLPGKLRSYEAASDITAKGEKQQAIIAYLRGKTAVPEDILKQATGCSKQTLNALLKRGAIVERFTPEFSQGFAPLPEWKTVLSAPQQEAVTSICAATEPSLLFGITGSGKTEVYAELIRQVIAKGKSAIVLVPEIFLTTQTVQKLQMAVSPESIAVLHSKITESQRRSEWRRIRFGGVRLVIGSRSALFAPVRDLGLVIIDEEHEWTYKNEQTPRYHARETAETLCRESGAKLVLGTATPSLEAWQRVRDGRYAIARLPERFAGASLPKVSVVDLVQVKFGSLYPFSKTLIAAIEERLARKEQSVLFLNRRGLASALLCLGCRRKVLSPDSGVPFTVHPGQGNSLILRDHTSGRSMAVPSVCPHCDGANLRSIGAGTQRIEALVKQCFPHARLLRADSDALLKPEDMQQVLSALQSGEADILIGTQSVVKGLDLPNVTLAAVLIADVGLSLPQFRAGERTFQLITQLIGRSGRAKPGEVIVQTFRPDAPEIRHAVFHETEAYMEEELLLRTAAHYPPSEPMARIVFRAPDAQRNCKLAFEHLKSAADSSIRISHAPTLLGQGKEWHILIRGKQAHELVRKNRTSSGVVDIDPLDCI